MRSENFTAFKKVSHFPSFFPPLLLRTSNDYICIRKTAWPQTRPATVLQQPCTPIKAVKPFCYLNGHRDPQPFSEASCTHCFYQVWCFSRFSYQNLPLANCYRSYCKFWDTQGTAWTTTELLFNVHGSKNAVLEHSGEWCCCPRAPSFSNTRLLEATLRISTYS